MNCLKDINCMDYSERGNPCLINGWFHTSLLTHSDAEKSSIYFMSEREQHYLNLISYYPIGLEKGWKRPSYTGFIWRWKKSLIAFSWLKARERVASLKDSLSSHTKAHFQSPREHGHDLWLQCSRSKWNVFSFHPWPESKHWLSWELRMPCGEEKLPAPPYSHPLPKEQPAVCCFAHFVVLWDMPQTYFLVSWGRERNEGVGLRLHKG